MNELKSRNINRWLPGKNRAELKDYPGMQTFMGITENNIKNYIKPK